MYLVLVLLCIYRFVCFVFFFFFNDTATTEIYTLSLHDALPISCNRLSCLTIKGVDQPLGSSRGCRHSSLPLILSNAATKSAPSWSQFTTSTFPARAGELPSPNEFRVCILPRSFCQRTFPLRSRP